ncbi:hypothetical protein LQV05_001561 [Cryptococcus neoformans]|nr:hypothetical protein LQV05_001561 [Cryptococcus neoformans]
MPPRTYLPPSTVRRSTRLHPSHPFPLQIASTQVLDLSSLSDITPSYLPSMSSHQATYSPSMRPRALSVGATARSHDPIHTHTSTGSVQPPSTISHPQPLAHEITQLYETDMNNRLATYLQHVDTIYQQRFNELHDLFQATHGATLRHSTPLHQADPSLDTSPSTSPTPPLRPTSPQPVAPPTQPPTIPLDPPSSTSVIDKNDSALSTSQPTRLKASDLPKFYGRDDDDIVYWVQKISSIKRGSQATDSDILRLLPSLLRGNAFNYYARLSEKEHTSLTTWAAWSKEPQDRFLPPNRLDDLEEKCIHSYLGPNEKFANYYEDKVYLQQFLFPANTEDFLLIRDILGGIPATLRAQLQTGVTPTMSLREFRLHVLQIKPGFRPQFFPTNHRRSADRTRTQRNNHSNTSFANSSIARSSRFLPGNRPEKPSTPCFTCGAYHWSDQCTLKKQQQQVLRGISYIYFIA